MEIKPDKIVPKKELKPIEKKLTTFEKVTTTTKGTQRRTDAVVHNIDELKDNRTRVHKMLGFLIQDLDAKDLIENFAEVKKYFEQYREFGITIPEEILNNFEPSGGAPLLGSPAYITEAQAKELIKLAYEGERMLQQKQFHQREIDYGIFQTKDVITEAAEHLTKEDLQNFLSISTSLKKLEAKPKDRLVLKISDSKLHEKLQFVRENNLKLNLTLESNADIKAMITFMNNKDNYDLLQNLEVLQLPNIDTQNIDQVNELLKLMATHCPNLTSLSCKNIYVDLNLPQFAKLKTFSCETILGGTLTLSQLDNLDSILCEHIWGNLALSQLPNLTSFSCKDIRTSLNLSQLPSLTSFSCEAILADLALSQLPNLTFFSCENIQRDLTLSQLDNLVSFRCKDIWGANLTLSQLDKLTSISGRFISTKTTIIFPEKLPNLKEIKFTSIDSRQARESIEQLLKTLNIKIQKEPDV